MVAKRGGSAEAESLWTALKADPIQCKRSWTACYHNAILAWSGSARIITPHVRYMAAPFNDKQEARFPRRVEGTGQVPAHQGIIYPLGQAPQSGTEQRLILSPDRDPMKV